MTEYETANAQHQGARDEQQDAAGVGDASIASSVHAGVVGVLSDGMGGMSHGSAAARLAVRAFLDGYSAKAREEDVPTALQRSLEAANQAVLEFARTNNCERNVGATIVAASIRDDELHWISAGDSRAYLIREGRLYRLTVDHTFGEDRRFLVHTDLSPAAEAESNDPEQVSSFVGYPGRPKTDASFRALRLVPGDCVLLASDGLYKSLPEDEVASYLDEDLRAGCKALVDGVISQRVSGQDNVTVLAMRRKDVIASGRGSAPRSGAKSLLRLK